MSLLLIIQICLAFVAVSCAVVCLRQGSRSLRTTKRLREAELEISDLTSQFESLLDSHKRLRSRTGMRELRAREEPAPVETKADVRRRLFGGATGPAFAKAQIDASRTVRPAQKGP